MPPTWLQSQFAKLLLALFVVTAWALTFTLLCVDLACVQSTTSARISAIEAQLNARK